MSTIHGDAAGSPVNCEQNARGTLFRKAMIASLLYQEPETLKQDVHDCSASSGATWKTADAEERSSGTQDYSMAPSAKSLDFANQFHAHLKAHSVFNHHPTIMGDMPNGYFKYVFEFAITPAHLS
jgi:hypothetical protein